MQDAAGTAARPILSDISRKYPLQPSATSAAGLSPTSRRPWEI